jgi:hypothetical protein
MNCQPSIPNPVDEDSQEEARTSLVSIPLVSVLVVSSPRTGGFSGQFQSDLAPPLSMPSLETSTGEMIANILDSVMELVDFLDFSMVGEDPLAPRQ